MLVIVVLSVAIAVGLARYGSTLPMVAQLLGEKPPRTTTGPAAVEGIRDLEGLATVRWTEQSVPFTRESGGDLLERLFNGEKVLVIATGNVEAGVDLGAIHEDDVSVDGDTFTIDSLNIHPDDGLVEKARLRSRSSKLRPARTGSSIPSNATHRTASAPSSSRRGSRRRVSGWRMRR